MVMARAIGVGLALLVHSIVSRSPFVSGFSLSPIVARPKQLPAPGVSHALYSTTRTKADVGTQELIGDDSAYFSFEEQVRNNVDRVKNSERAASSGNFS